MSIMKKMFFSALGIGLVVAASAQDVTLYKDQNPNTTVATISTMPPVEIRSAFDAEYPGMTVIAWEPVDTWWKASYNTDNRMTYVYFNEQAVDYKVALPVLTNNVPEDVVTAAIRTYGPALYGITHVKAADNSDAYQVRLMKDGTTDIAWMDGSGASVSNVFRTSSDQASVTINQ
jgi:hypothetical protein